VTDDDGPETRRDAPGPRWQHDTADARSGPLRTKSVFDATGERFDLGDELGRGGMGRVVEAQDTRLDRAVAIKQALSDDDENLARFEREVLITAKLEHPSIVPVHDVGRDPSGRPYYVMRRIDGEPLSSRVAAAPDLRARIALVTNVLAAVDAAAFAHARGVIHRDIKPWNILIGAYGETLLIDWGLARELAVADVPSGPSRPSEAALTRAGNALGTPGYMAPEQVSGREADARADVYSLGVTLFHVLAGVPPFHGMTPDEWLAHAQKKPLDVPLDKLPEDVPRELVTIVGKATAIDPAGRYRDAGELAGDLRAFLAGQLVGAHHYSSWERLRRWVRKHGIAVATAAVGLVALVAIGVFAIVNIVRERDAAAAAREMAADRAEAMLLERASNLAPRDPTRAVALLRDVPPSSPGMKRARDIAAVAEASGITHGMQAHRSAVSALALSGDGELLASGGADGALMIHDLAARTSRTLVTGEPIWRIAWFGDGASLVYASMVGLEQADVATGKHRVLADGAKTFWKVDEHRLRYQVGTTLYELGTGGVKVLAEDVNDVNGGGEVIVMDGGGRLRSLDANGEHELARVEGAGLLSGMRALTPDGSRVAAIFEDAIVEYDTHTGAPLRRFPFRSVGVFYLDGLLYARPAGQAGVFEVFERSGSHAPSLIRGTFSVELSAEAFGGSVLVTDDGTLAFVREGYTHRFALDNLAMRSLAAHPASPIVAVGSTDGTIRWWDLRTFIPQRLDLPHQPSLCGIDRDNVYALGGLGVYATSRSGGAPRLIATGPYSNCNGTQRGLVAKHIPYGPNQDDDIIDSAGHVQSVPRGVVLDYDTGSLFVVENQRDVVELTPSGERRRRMTLTENIIRLTARHGWLAAVTQDRHVTRIDPAGRRSTWAIDRPVDMFSLSATGDVWFTSGNDVLHSDGKTSTPIGTFPVGIYDLGGLGDGTAGLVAKDNSVWQLTRQGPVVRGQSGQRVGTLGAHTMSSVEGGYHIETLFLETGERIVRLAPGLIFKVVHAGRALVAQSPGDSSALVYESTVPDDPAQLRAWIDRATNAAVGAGDALVWR
jgi:WD40 repeat protein